MADSLDDDENLWECQVQLRSVSPLCPLPPIIYSALLLSALTPQDLIKIDARWLSCLRPSLLPPKSHLKSLQRLPSQ